MNKINGKVTMKDVAEKAGVSLVTVSRTLRSPNMVNDETRFKINTAISELGYIWIWRRAVWRLGDPA